MTQVIDLELGRLKLAAKKAFRNWASAFKEDFGLDTRPGDISLRTLAYLSQGKDRATFFLYDLIMNLQNMGSGLEFNELNPRKKVLIIDQYLFLLDRIRFECMKRLGWLASYPGEEYTLVEMITQFHILAPNLQARIPLLRKNHPRYDDFRAVDRFDREAFIRKMIPEAIQEIQTLEEKDA